MSFHASCAKLPHSSLMKSWISCRPPASRMTTLMPFCASSLPSVPPPAPEPTMQTTLSSLRSKLAMIACSPSDRRQPVDVVEAAMDVAAVLGGGPLVAELRPDLLLVVQRDHKVAADLAEERRLLHALQHDDALLLPRHVDIGGIEVALGVLVGALDAERDHLVERPIAARLGVVRRD